MNSRYNPAVRVQTLIGLGVFVLAIFLAWQIGEVISSNDVRALIYLAAVLAGFFVIVTTLRNWRSGFYLFLIWMLSKICSGNTWATDWHFFSAKTSSWGSFISRSL